MIESRSDSVTDEYLSRKSQTENRATILGKKILLRFRVKRMSDSITDEYYEGGKKSMTLGENV